MSTNIRIPRFASRQSLANRGGISTNVVHTPGTGGMVTDSPSWMLKQNQSPNMQDIIFPRGVASLRGAPLFSTAFSAPAAVRPTVGIFIDDKPQYIGAYTFPSPTLYPGSSLYPTSYQITVAHYSSWQNNTYANIANSLNSSTYYATNTNGLAQTKTAYYPFVKWGDEVLWFPQDGTSSILRTNSSQQISADTATGTVTFNANSQNVQAVSGTFPSGSLNGYVFAPFAPTARIQAQSSTFATMTGYAPVSWSNYSSIPLHTTSAGVIGLLTTVQDVGFAQSASGTSVTGTGTSWTLSGLGYGVVAAGDVITFKGTNSSYSRVSAVSSTNALTTTVSVDSGNGGAFAPYRIGRYLVGTHGCIHNQRLWVVGCAWQRRRLYYSPLTSSTEAGSTTSSIPVPWTLGDQTNGFYSFLTNAGDASEMPYLDVPDQNTIGKLVGVASTQSGLLILATDGAYLLHGDPPSESVRLLAASADCIDNRSIVASHNGVFWAGLQGIWMFTGGRITDLTEHAGRAQEWSVLAQNVSQNSGSIISWFTQNHLSIQASYGSTTQTWVYDLHRQVWCGNHTVGPYTAGNVQIDYDEAYTVNSSGQVYAMSNVVEDSGNADPTAYPILDLPLSACGVDVSEQRRVVENKTTFEFVPATSSSVVSVQSLMDYNVSGFSEDGQLSLPTGTPKTSVITQRILPNNEATGYLGKVGNAYSIRYTFPDGGPANATTWRIHMITLQVRNWNPRVQ